EEAAERAKNVQPFAAETERGPEDWSKAIREVFPEPAAPPPPLETAAPAAESLAAPDLSAAAEPAAAEPPAAEAAPEPAPELPPLANSWMAGALSPWEAELQRANQLTSTWESAKIAPIAVEETSATEAFLDSGLMTSPGQAPEPVAEPAAEASL